jgi:hypothetical protein
MNAKQTTAAKDATEREAKGRFAKGNSGGPGNPYARLVAALRKAAIEAVTPEDIRDIINALKEKAKTGDLAAAKLLLSYTLGKPAAAAPDPDRLDRHELQTIAGNHLDSPQEVLDIIKGVPLDLVMEILHAMLPSMREDQQKMAAQDLNDAKEALYEPEETEDDSNATSSLPPVEIPAWMQQLVKKETSAATSTSTVNPVIVEQLDQIQQQVSALAEAQHVAKMRQEEKGQPLTNESNRNSAPSAVDRSGSTCKHES